MNIQNSVFYVGGSKGGVGKSLFSFALVDYLLNRNANVLLVDTDTDNPDVFKAHKDLALPNLLCRLNSLDDADGWADLLDTVQNYPDHAVVINAAARTKTSTASYGDIMKEALREMRPITEAKHYIQQHYQEALRLEDVSTAVGFNATYFSTLFKKETGQNFMDYLTELRISKAKELLCGEELSVQDVAEQVGYRDLKYFSRLFKKLTGVSPSDYKKLYK